MKARLILFPMILAISSTAFAWNTGDRVLGQWSDGLWYPARIAAVSDQGLGVNFDDGDKAVLQPSQIRRITWARGTRVQCNFRGAGAYYWGTITEMRGESIHINYDDGNQEDTTISLCRSR